ncbi:MAG: hypothetical protein LBV60_03130 [Streptomyces sp.]|jgi:hypothetical protein|nr:hypothetical protein [Streptomyces sp.]
MSTDNRTRLFGPDRSRVGYADTEWSVWILGTDDIHDQTSLADALEFAAGNNAMFADLRLNSSTEFDPVPYAVVLHHGYAWTQATEHAHNVDCGIRACGPCSFDRAIPAVRCKRCKDTDGPFTFNGLCEPCVRPMPLTGAM